MPEALLNAWSRLPDPLLDFGIIPLFTSVLPWCVTFQAFHAVHQDGVLRQISRVLPQLYIANLFTPDTWSYPAAAFLISRLFSHLASQHSVTINTRVWLNHSFWLCSPSTRQIYLLALDAVWIHWRVPNTTVSLYSLSPFCKGSTGISSNHLSSIIPLWLLSTPHVSHWSPNLSGSHWHFIRPSDNELDQTRPHPRVHCLRISRVRVSCSLYADQMDEKTER